MDPVTRSIDNKGAWTVVSDDRCPVVRFMTAVIRRLDRHHFFQFITKADGTPHSQSLLAELDACPWSLLIIDNENQRREGPEAIPFILKNLPAGKLAVVFYLLPGTMWLTQQLYLLVSTNKRKAAALKLPSGNITT